MRKTPHAFSIGSFILFLFFSLFTYAQKTGLEVLKKMHDKNRSAMCRFYTFSQRNTHYQNDTMIGNSVWHESVGLPDKFRILFGDSAKGNSVLFRNDSVYHYRKGTLARSGRDSNNLLLLLGGMYFRDFEDVKARLAGAGYNLSRLSEAQWQKEAVYVVGADSGDETSNQFWVEKKDFRIVRIIEKINEKDMMDMRFEGHQKWCDGFVENKVSFRRNGSLEQVEEYYNLKKTDRFW